MGALGGSVSNRFADALAPHRLHTGDSPYPCTACGEGYRTKAELNQHNRLHHGGVNQNTANANQTIVTTGHQQIQVVRVVGRHLD